MRPGDLVSYQPAWPAPADLVGTLGVVVKEADETDELSIYGCFWVQFSDGTMAVHPDHLVPIGDDSETR